jgi:hypothetical protein
MKKPALQSVTSLPPSPDQERHSRMIKYTVAMSIRVLCFLLIFVVPGWWRLIPVAGTIILPYVAVVLANTARRTTANEPLRPGGIVPLGYTDDRATQEKETQERETHERETDERETHERETDE